VKGRGRCNQRARPFNELCHRLEAEGAAPHLPLIGDLVQGRPHQRHQQDLVPWDARAVVELLVETLQRVGRLGEHPMLRAEGGVGQVVVFRIGQKEVTFRPMRPRGL
jgi:hypothetical protein